MRFHDFVGADAHILKISDEIMHRLSHQLLHIRFFTIKIEQFAHVEHYDLIAIDELDKYPVPRVIEEYIKNSLF